MSVESVAGVLADDRLRVAATTGSGHEIVMDDAKGDGGPRPAEVLLAAQAGCTAMDVVSVLRKKRQRFSRYAIRVSGEQREDAFPHVFERIRIVHVVDGEVGVAAMRRAIQLSATTYCTVAANLASGVTQIDHAYLIRDDEGNEQYGHVITTGPLGAVTGTEPAPVGAVIGA